ncbi:hypothetical protein Pla144_23250 [Bythopirellula polymerisocia]|uniref:VanZ like family protein n=1 Tax=Bythopirellula polymerisocia TaxID=2528003 RepID=A0A5C6CT32_9BACT|nr:hypothetical protein Pla144_23250 [Bythopirellula polymerisocia]
MFTRYNILRWICFIPAGFISAFLVSFPVHWFVMVNLGGWAFDPLIVIDSEQTLRAIELFLQAGAGSLAFVYFASSTAPSHRFFVSIFLAVIVTLGLEFAVYWLNVELDSGGSNYEFRGGFYNTVARVVGATAASYLIWHSEKRQSDL